MTFDRLRTIVRLRLRSLFAGRTVDRELDEELQFHIEQQIESHLAGGMSPNDARVAAMRAMGGLELRKEQCRDTRGVSAMEHLARDVRMALRQWRRQPAFAATAILSLALGIGANTAFFQLLNALSLRRLPVASPDALVEVQLTGPGRSGRHTGRNRQLSLPQYQQLAARQRAFSSLLAFGDTRFNVSPGGEVRYVEGLWVSGNFFSTLGVPPLLGRLIAPADDVPGCGAGVAVVSYAFWQSVLGARGDVIGQPLPGAGAHVPIIGVTPPEFFGVEVGRQYGVARPLCASGNTRRDHWWLAIIGRLNPGWTRAQAHTHLTTILPDVQRDTLPDFRDEYARDYLKMGVEAADASSGVSPLRRDYERPLWILVAISALVLLIAAVNLANLLLAQATARRQEFSMRLALGGSRSRVLQQVLIESLVVAFAGSAAAIAVATAVSQSIPPLISTATDVVHLDLTIDWSVFAFTAAVGAGTAVIFGMAPAIRAAGASLNVEGGRGTAGNSGLTLRRVLVATQVAVTLVLLFGGLLFVRTFRNLSTLDTGVNAREVLVANVFLAERGYPPESRQAALRALDDRLRAAPGVLSLADAFTTPMGGSFRDTRIVVNGVDAGESNVNEIGPGYFATLQTRLLAGRDFDARDTAGSPRVAIVNESFAAAYLDGEPIGRRFTIPADRGGKGTEYQVVGLVENQKYLNLRERAPRILYTASSQNAAPGLTRRYVMRMATSRAESMRAVSATLADADPSASVRYAMLDTQIGDAMLQERLMARLSAAFGGVALLLAVVGLYGVVSYAVARRRGEIGVRVALGATRAQILSMILADVGRTLALGIGAGTVLALLASRGVGSLLYGLEPGDVTTLMVAGGVLAGAGLASAAWPARQAATIDPVGALRQN